MTKLDRIRKLIGDVAYARLLEGLGGRRVTVPAKAGEHHYLTRIIGQAAADKLCHEFSNDRVDLPIQAKKRALIVQALAAKLPKTEIARTYFVTERYVYKVQEEEGEAEAEPLQGRLF